MILGRFLARLRREFAWIGAAFTVLAAVLFALYVHVTLGTVREGLPAAILAQERDIALVFHDLGDLQRSIERLQSEPMETRLREAQMLVAATRQRVFAVRGSYEFDNLVGASALHAVAHPAVEDIDRWLTSGLNGLPPTSPAVTALAHARARDALLQAKDLYLQSNQIARQLLDAEARRIEELRRLVMGVTALLIASAVGGIILVWRSRQAERRQEAAERLLGEAITTINEGFILFDRDDRLVMHNRRYLDFYSTLAEHCRPGVTFARLCRLFAESGQVVDAAGRIEEWIGERIARHREPGKPFEMMLADGRVVEVSERRLPDGSRVAVHSDVTDRKRTETALRQSEARLRAIFEHASLGLLLIQKDGRIVQANPAIVQMLGYRDEAELCSLTVDDITHPDDREKTRRALENLYLGGGRHYRFEKRYLRRDGSIMWGRLSSSFVASPISGRYYAAGLIEDITDLRQAERDLHLAATVFDSSSEGIVITDPGGVTLRVNETFSRITGFRAEEMVGQKPRLFDKEGQEADIFDQIRSVARQRDHWQGEVWGRRRDGEHFPQWLTVSVVRGQDGEITHYVGVFSDITERKEVENRLRYLATHDSLTGLANRTHFQERLSHTIARARRSDRPVGVMFLDLDHFKVINDSLGHQAGDQLLQIVAARLMACLRETDTVARLGGDEFTIILEGADDWRDVAVLAERILAALAEPMVVEQQEVRVTTSIGIVLYPQDGEDIQALLKNADVAAYHAKSLGRNTYQFFKAEMNAQAERRLWLEQSLRSAIEHDELVLHYQPRVALDSGRIVGVEALIRWRTSSGELMLPGEFIPLAEEAGIIHAVGAWVLRTACQQIRAWEDAGLGAVPVSVNLSARQLQQRNFPEIVRETIQSVGIDPALVEFELTESFVMANPEEVVSLLQALKDLGVSLAIDDFGTGYSSLSYLKRLPVDTIKIDRSFIRDIPADPEDVAITSAIVAMAQSLELHVVAEGVELAEQCSFLATLGCTEVQGYHFSRPLPADAMEEMLRAGGHLPVPATVIGLSPVI